MRSRTTARRRVIRMQLPRVRQLIALAGNAVALGGTPPDGQKIAFDLFWIRALRRSRRPGSKPK